MLIHLVILNSPIVWYNLFKVSISAYGFSKARDKFALSIFRRCL